VFPPSFLFLQPLLFNHHISSLSTKFHRFAPFVSYFVLKVRSHQVSPTTRGSGLAPDRTPRFCFQPPPPPPPSSKSSTSLLPPSICTVLRFDYWLHQRLRCLPHHIPTLLLALTFDISTPHLRYNMLKLVFLFS
jgi:hypothetical protein